MDDLIRPEKESPCQDPDITPPLKMCTPGHMLCSFERVRICYDVPEGMNGLSVFLRYIRVPVVYNFLCSC